MRSYVVGIVMSLSVGCLILSGAASLGWVGGYELFYNPTHSLQPGFYLCHQIPFAQPAQKGDLVTLRPPPEAQAMIQRYRPAGTSVTRLWLKQLVAGEGDEVCLTDTLVILNRTPLVKRPLMELYEAEITQLPGHFHGCKFLKRGEVFTLGTDPLSFDSRYVGLGRLADLKHTCRLVWAE